MKKLFVLFFLLAYFFLPHAANAQTFNSLEQSNEEILEGRVEKVLDKKYAHFNIQPQYSQKLQVHITKGSLQGKSVIIQTNFTPYEYKAGKTLLIGHVRSGNDAYFYIIDYARYQPLLLLLGLFIFLVLLVTRKKGLTSLLGMAVSFLVLFFGILPAIVRGTDPTLAALIGLSVIIPVTFYLAHGINKKTTVAITSTVLTLLITILLAKITIDAVSITGLFEEEIIALIRAKQSSIPIPSLLISGIIISALGILDDVTIAQTATVEQLAQVLKKTTFTTLYNKTMQIGHDHIASVVNTLILVYTGASMPVLLLFVIYPRPLTVLLNSEIVAVSVISALICTISLIIAVPISTALTAVTFTKYPPKKQ